MHRREKGAGGTPFRTVETYRAKLVDHVLELFTAKKGHKSSQKKSQSSQLRARAFRGRARKKHDKRRDRMLPVIPTLLCTHRKSRLHYKGACEIWLYVLYVDIELAGACLHGGMEGRTRCSTIPQKISRAGCSGSPPVGWSTRRHFVYIRSLSKSGYVN